MSAIRRAIAVLLRRQPRRGRYRVRKPTQAELERRAELVGQLRREDRRKQQ